MPKKYLELSEENIHLLTS